jgi:putative membrane protein
VRTASRVEILALVATAAAALAATPTSQPSNPDQKFMLAAAKDGLKEVALGRLASSQGDSPAVRDCGKMMVADHSAANDQLLTIALQENLTPPRDLSPEAQATYDKLSGLHGKAFDQAFLSAMTDDHKDDIEQLQREVDKGSDVAVKDWARNTLPTLKHHLDMVQRIRAAASK